MEPLSRPTPPRSLGRTSPGVGRLVRDRTTGCRDGGHLIVCAGAVWLVRTPPPAIEASLPRAAAAARRPNRPRRSIRSNAPLQSTQRRRRRDRARPRRGRGCRAGVYELAGDARVRDAIVAAGGPTEAADWNALNLAAAVADGVKVYVPTGGRGGAAVVDRAVGCSGWVDPPAGPIDVNVATIDELETLPGVGTRHRDGDRHRTRSQRAVPRRRRPRPGARHRSGQARSAARPGGDVSAVRSLGQNSESEIEAAATARAIAAPPSTPPHIHA